MSSPDSTGEIFGWEMTVNGQTRAFDKVFKLHILFLLYFPLSSQLN
jgi:hypothetical protein